MADNYYYGLSVDDNSHLKVDHSLQTLVLITLLTRGRADPEDPVPDASDLGGWWGDTYADVDGRKIGSKRWILVNAPATQETLELARQYDEDALKWMVEDGILDNFFLEYEIQDRGGEKLLATRVGLVRPNNPTVAWLNLWDVTLSPLSAWGSAKTG